MILYTRLWGWALLLEVIRCVLFYVMEAVEGELCLLEVMEGMRRVLFRILETVECGVSLLGVLNVLEVLEVIRCVLSCIQ